MRNAGGELAERGQLLGLHQSILRGAQFIERLRQFPGSFLDLFEQADVAEGDHRLICEGPEKIDNIAGEWSGVAPRDTYRADRDTLAQHGYDEGAAVTSCARKFLHARRDVRFCFHIGAERKLSGPRDPAMN